MRIRRELLREGEKLINTKQSDRKKISLIFFTIFFILFLISIFALRFDPEIKDLENGVYNQLTESFVEDGDLNIINQLPEYRRKIVTKSFNHPDLHDHGIVMLWYPVYLYSKLLKKLEISLDYYKRRSYRSTMVLINVFFMLLILLLSYKTIGITGKRNHSLDLIFILFGTPLYWYGFIHPSTSDVTSAIFPFIFFYLHGLCIQDNKRSLWFIYGVIVAIGVVVKVSLLFYYILPFHYLYLCRRSFKQAVVDSVPSFFAGSFCVGILFFTNEYLKYGRLHYGYAGIVSEYSVLAELTFGPAGFFVVSPLYLLVLISMLYILFTKSFEKNSFLFFLFFAPVLKILTESYNFVGNGDYGGRHLITDHFVLLMLFPTLYFQGKKTKLFLRLVAAVFMVQCLYMGWVFSDGISGKEFLWGVEYATSLKYITNNIDRISYFFGNFLDGLWGKELIEVLKYLPIIIVFSLMLSVVFVADFKNKELRKKVITYFTLFCFTNYLIITVLNLVNNKVNSRKYSKEGMFERSVIVDGSEAFHFDDNVGNILMHIRFSDLRKDEKSKQLALEALRVYLKRVEDQIVVDPVGFKDQLQVGDFDFYDPFD